MLMLRLPPPRRHQQRKVSLPLQSAWQASSVARARRRPARSRPPVPEGPCCCPSHSLPAVHAAARWAPRAARRVGSGGSQKGRWEATEAAACQPPADEREAKPGRACGPRAKRLHSEALEDAGRQGATAGLLAQRPAFCSVYCCIILPPVSSFCARVAGGQAPGAFVQPRRPACRRHTQRRYTRPPAQPRAPCRPASALGYRLVAGGRSPRLTRAPGTTRGAPQRARAPCVCRLSRTHAPLLPRAQPRHGRPGGARERGQPGAPVCGPGRP